MLTGSSSRRTASSHGGLISHCHSGTVVAGKSGRVSSWESACPGPSWGVSPDHPAMRQAGPPCVVLTGGEFFFSSSPDLDPRSDSMSFFVRFVADGFPDRPVVLIGKGAAGSGVSGWSVSLLPPERIVFRLVSGGHENIIRSHGISPGARHTLVASINRDAGVAWICLDQSPPAFADISRLPAISSPRDAMIGRRFRGRIFEFAVYRAGLKPGVVASLCDLWR